MRGRFQDQGGMFSYSADAEPTSIGHRWQHGGRNAPTVLNAVFNHAQFWDGRAKDLEQQAGGPIINPVEMASPEPHVAEQLKGIPGYREAFAKAFPDEPDPITLGNAQKAIAVFETTLITPNAPFDRFLKGDANALSPIQKEGLCRLWDRADRRIVPPIAGRDRGRHCSRRAS
jgi:cytochrome c peroxidase